MSTRGWVLVSALALSLGCPAETGRRPGGARDTGGVDGGGGGVDAGPGVDGGGVDAPGHDVPILPDPDAGCEVMEPLETTIIGDPPDMMLVVDISGSMCTPLGFSPMGRSKMSIMKEALITQVDDKHGRINFGLMLFPHSSGECAAGQVEVPIAPRNADPIRSRLSSLAEDMFSCAFMNSGATPTGPSIDATRTHYAGIPVNPVGRYALLATDGLPNCGPETMDGGTEETVDETVAAIEALRLAGVNTYVLGFGSGFGSDRTALDRMATAGGTGMPYSADSASSLDAALDAIAAEVIPPSCIVELGGPVRDPRLFQVRFDGGELIPRDTSRSRGWDYDPDTNTITFYGPECAAIESGSVENVDVDFGCPGPLI